MTWLVTGGAGYIGAHVVGSMGAAGFPVVVLDDLSTGVPERVPAGVPVVVGSVTDAGLVERVCREHAVVGVVHIAAKKSVPESVRRPDYYYAQNVGGFGALLTAMEAAGVRRMVYSSSAAVFGTPEVPLVDEDAPTAPENPYGRSKLICEWMLSDTAAVRDLQYVTLRYFNVAGAGTPELGDTGITNLIPAVFRALSDGGRPQVFGGDWPTRDGSCVRDYIHVVDIARAHVAAAQRLAGDGADYRGTFNVGRGEGVTVKEVMAAVAEVTGRQFAYDVVQRRAGDPAQVVGAVDRIAADLSWRAEFDLREMVRSAWASWQWLNAR
jgi:UDP-glucose 4-epimerase